MAGADPSRAEPPLAGVRVLLTRPESRARGTVDALERAGATVAVLPLVATVPVDLPVVLDDALRRLPAFCVVVFTSVPGVDVFVARAARLGVGPDTLAALPVAAVGPATARRVAERGMEARWIPAQAHGAALADLLRGLDTAGREALVVRAAGGGDDVPAALAAAGARVCLAEVYHTVPPPDLALRMAPWLAAPPDALVLASPSAARHLAAALQGDLARFAAATRVVAIGPTTAAACRSRSLGPAAVAPAPTPAGIVDAVQDAIRHHPLSQTPEGSAP